MSVILSVENLSKVYRLGQTGTGTLKRDLHRWWTINVQKKADPFAVEPIHSQVQGDTLWALKDVSFEVNQGDLFGIVGANGSGKSTLLKILSRIVRPTSGTVRGKGVISSLLEIGTGFNADLTGRENIYMSGYFLGMSKQEVQQRFDAIVDFSGVERFIDTPVKRYSTGMYMRLAFSVAAHLEPDILIVDEVLAVGDAEFQAKCLTKMKEASHIHGRTILLVSHDAQIVANICNKAIWLENGKTRRIGSPEPVLNHYLFEMQQRSIDASGPAFDDAEMALPIEIKSMAVFSGENQPITVESPVNVYIEFFNRIEEGYLKVNFRLLTNEGICVFDIGTHSIKATKNIIVLKVVIPGNLLNDAVYSISLKVLKDVFGLIREFDHCASFKVQDLRLGMDYFGEWSGIVRPKIQMDFYTKDSQKVVSD